jgi:poly(beta-D-mannuronate) lyase
MKIIAFVLMLMLTTQLSFGETFTINNETEFKQTLAKVNPGDEIIIANGSYHNWNIQITNKGTAQKPIVITAATAGKVIFTGVTNQTLFKIEGAYIHLQDLVFEQNELIKSEGKTGVLIELKNAINCVISNCSFNNNTVKAQFMPLVIISGNGQANQVTKCSFTGNIDSQDVQVKITKESCPQQTLISENSFSDKKRVSWKNGNGGECIQVGQDPVLLGTIEAHTMVSKNTFTSCNGENEVISNKSSRNSYLNNTFIENDGELVMRGGHDCTIAGNVFKGGTGGIRINGSGHQVTNNKISNIKTAIRLMYGMAKGKKDIGFYVAATNCILKNNTISNAQIGILIGDSKDADWTGKFDQTRYPSPTLQNVAPSDNQLSNNQFLHTAKQVVEL